MVDTWATVATCAQIGRNVHLAGGVGIGGVLEPPNATPVIIEDDCMIGSRCMITQGARVGRGSILAEATVLNPGIPVIDAETGEEVGKGVVPPDCIVVRADRKRQFPGGEFYLPCALIIRRIQPGERTVINDILREAGVSVT
jgi:2,3,4,5-tetrahydropyridine-2-carboxylate N-succinyltransferase